MITNNPYERITRGVTLHFDSCISHSIEYIEIVKNLKRFLPMAPSSKVMVVLPNARPIPRYWPKKSNYGASA